MVPEARALPEARATLPFATVEDVTRGTILAYIVLFLGKSSKLELTLAIPVLVSSTTEAVISLLFGTIVFKSLATFVKLLTSGTAPTVTPCLPLSNSFSIKLRNSSVSATIGTPNPVSANLSPNAFYNSSILILSLLITADKLNSSSFNLLIKLFITPSASNSASISTGSGSFSGGIYYSIWPVTLTVHW